MNARSALGRNAQALRPGAWVDVPVLANAGGRWLGLERGRESVALFQKRCGARGRVAIQVSYACEVGAENKG